MYSEYTGSPGKNSVTCLKPVDTETEAQRLGQSKSTQLQTINPQDESTENKHERDLTKCLI